MIRSRLTTLYYLLRKMAGAIPRERLFILGHMRGGTSLLAHILNTNPDIAIFGESHSNYRSQDDVDQLAITVCRFFGDLCMRSRYIGDKILHSEIEIHESMLSDKRHKFLFSVRIPRDTVASIQKLKLDFTREKAELYYLKQLRWLRETWDSIADPDRKLLFRYEDLLSDTDQLLQQLTRFLELSERLTPYYKTHQATGKRAIGDSSEKIKTGHVIKDKGDFSLKPPEVAEECLQEYCKTIRHLGGDSLAW